MLSAYSGRAQAFCLERTNSLCHPDITRRALGFLRPEVLDAVVVGVWEADEGIQKNASSVHFDECDFKDGGEFIAERYQSLVTSNLDPNDTRTCSSKSRFPRRRRGDTLRPRCMPSHPV